MLDSNGLDGGDPPFNRGLDEMIPQGPFQLFFFFYNFIKAFMPFLK